LRYQRYDWNVAALGEWIEIPLPEAIVVEGVYTLRPELRNTLDFTVFVQTGEPTRLQRQISRAEGSSIWISRWLAAEDFYVSRERLWEWADVLIGGEGRWDRFIFHRCQ
jgi:uridine kinase